MLVARLLPSPVRGGCAVGPIWVGRLAGAVAGMGGGVGRYGAGPDWGRTPVGGYPGCGALGYAGGGGITVPYANRLTIIGGGL